MKLLHRLFRALFERSKLEQDMDVELRFHIEAYTRDLTASGVDPREAERRACAAFGGIAQVQEECRRSLWLHFPARVSQDIRYAVRVLAHRPAFAVLATSILAIGIGLNTAIFTVTDSALLRPLPFAGPDTLVALWERHPIIGRQEVATPDFHDWQARNHTLTAIAAHTMQGYIVPLWTSDGHSEPLEAALASSNLFPLLGVSPILGRVFTDVDDRGGHDNVVLIGERLWRTRFNSAVNVTGDSMTLDGEVFRIIGVLPSTAVPVWTDIWLPLSRSGPDTPAKRAGHNLEVIGRLKPGISVRQADEDIQGIAVQLAAEYPVTNGPTRGYAVPFRSNFTERLERALPLLQAGAVLVLIICCVNVAIFSLVHTAERRHEIEIRAALGANPAQLLIGSAAEALLIASGAGVFGLLLARLAVRVFEPRVQELLPLAGALTFGWRTLAFSICVCAVTAVCFGLVPAVQIAIRSMCRGSSRTATRRNAPVRAMIAVQTALSLVVVACTGLLVQSFRQILTVDAGFDTTRVAAVRVRLPIEKYETASSTQSFYKRLFPKLLALPGVIGVAASSQQPLRRLPGRFWIEGRPDPPLDQFPVAQFRGVTPEYFDVVGLRLRSGRLPHGTGENQPVVWVNEAFARRYFPERPAVGEAVLTGLFRPPRRRFPILGVVSDMRDLGLEVTPEPTVYWIDSSARFTLAIRGVEGRMAGLDSGIRAVLHDLESDAWATPLQTMDDVYASALGARRLSLELLGVFAVIACLLAGLGIHAIVRQAATERTREVGVRLALGARRSDVIAMFLVGHLPAVIVGLLAGGALAALSARMLQQMLFGVGAADPATYAFAAVLILLITATSAWFPARRCTQMNIITVLRSE